MISSSVFSLEILLSLKYGLVSSSSGLEAKLEAHHCKLSISVLQMFDH